MAKYTTQVRSIVESGVDLFDFSYPIFDETYRSVLEQKIIDYYYFREIGLETVGQFKHFLKAKLNVIMPYYNEHYLALEVFKTYDPYTNKDLNTTETRTINQDSDSTNDLTSKTTGKVTSSANSDETDTVTNREVFSDTPQSKLANLDYATNLTDVDNTSVRTSDGSSLQDTIDDVIGKTISVGSITTTDEYVQTIKGHDGMKYASDIYKGVKETIVNLDQKIIDELQDLFMNIY